MTPMFRILSALLFSAAFAGVATGADDPKAREIMEKVDARDDGDYATQEMEMILIDKRGNQRVRKLKSFGRDVGEDKQSIMFFYPIFKLFNFFRCFTMFFLKCKKFFKYSITRSFK